MELAQKVRAAYLRRQPPETCPMTDFDERDLIAFAEQAGFREMHLELQVGIEPFTEDVNWEAFLRTAPNPKAPTPEEAINETLTPSQAEQFISHLRPMVEAKQGTCRSAVAYLWAVK